MKILVAGAGASGLFAAYSAAVNHSGAEVVVVEKNEKAGKKIYITGKGRCNLTNNCEPREFFDNVVNNPKFAYSAIYGFDSAAVMRFFEENGLALKTERGNRVFPTSDKASDVTKTLCRVLEREGVELRLNTELNALTTTDKSINGAVLNGREEQFDAVILACGGKSYASTGSDGSGFRIAAEVGHKIVEPRPALVGIITKDAAPLAGLSLKNVSLALERNGKKYFQQFGEILFTHEGISGPAALTLSSYVNRMDLSGSCLTVDLKPALDVQTLDKRILRDFEENINRDFENSLFKLLPKSIVPLVVERSGIPTRKKVNVISAAERSHLVFVLKNLKFEVEGLCSLNSAVTTAGGVDVREINPNSMESLLIKGLFFCGEMIDVDALTGGFNLQLAFSTGMLAGKLRGIS